jgi:chromosome segregation ATPase
MEMSFAQALNEAKQVIVQQSNRIKADAEKIKQQQQTIVDQCSIITETEMKLREQTAESQKQQERIDALEANIAQVVVAREQAEAIVDRQGQRLTSYQEQCEAQERRIADQDAQIQRLCAERDAAREQAPSTEDQQALSAMAALLTTKKIASKDKPSLRMNDENRAEAA